MAEISEQERADLVGTAHEMADAARVATLRHFRTAGLLAENKLAADGYDPVTAGDREAETAMRAVLSRKRPKDGVLGEEFGSSIGSSGLTWVLDPIDGTRAYLAGTPTWGVLISVRDETGPLFGIIDQPYIGERFVGGFGLAEMTGPLGHAPLATRSAAPLSDAILFTTFPEVGTEADARAFHRLSRQVRLTRYGMDCYAYALVAGGHIDLVVEAALNPYDIQAPIAVIQAAGGIVTDWQGGPAHEGGRALAAANPEIHAAAMAVLAEATT